jgi:hypothetical protein
MDIEQAFKDGVIDARRYAEEKQRATKATSAAEKAPARTSPKVGKAAVPKTVEAGPQE